MWGVGCGVWGVGCGVQAYPCREYNTDVTGRKFTPINAREAGRWADLRGLEKGREWRGREWKEGGGKRGAGRELEEVEARGDC